MASIYGRGVVIIIIIIARFGEVLGVRVFYKVFNING